MTAIVKIGSAEAEIIAPGQGITLRLALHPLKMDAETFTAPAGLSIEELIAFGRSRMETGISCRMMVWLGGHELTPDYWRCVRPKPGTTVLVRAVAAGGGDLARTLLGLTVAVAGLALPGLLIPAGGLAASLLGAGITLGGQMLVNSLFPPAAPKLNKGSGASTSTAYSIGGSSNELAKWGAISWIFGKTRVYPKLAAQPYTEYVGSDQYIRMLLAVGYGPLDLSSIKSGETPIESFPGVEFEVRPGYVGDAPLTLFPNAVAQTDLSIALTHAGGAQLRTTAVDADELSVDFVAANGLGRVDSNGAMQNYTVTLRTEYSLTGAGVWQLLEEINLTARSTATIRRTLRKVVARGQYDVRVTKTSADYAGSQQVIEDVTWTALRSFTNEAPIGTPFPLATIALRLPASAIANGAIDQINVIAQSKASSWSADDADWLPNVVTNNPGDLFRLACQGVANPRADSDDRLDLETISRWGDYCRANGFVFDMERDYVSSVDDLLVDICAAGRATPIYRNGKRSVAWDDPDAPIVAHLTPRNASGSFSGTRLYSHPIHGLRIRFVNEQKGYIQDERIVYADGYDETNATIFEEIELPGQTNPDNVWRHGRYHLAQAALRPETYEDDFNIQQITVTRADRVRVAHDVPMWGENWGRVKSIAGLVVTLDEPVVMEAAKAYAIRFRLEDGSSSVTNVVTDDGEHDSVTIAAVPGLPQAGDLFMFGELGKESVVLRVLSIRAMADGAAHLTFVDDAPQIADADSGAIPAFDSQISVPTDPLTAAPINLVVRETLEGVSGDITSGAALTWETSAGERPVLFQTQYRDADGDRIWKDNSTISAPTKSDIVHNLVPGDWDFQVRIVFGDGSVSAWTLASLALTGLAGVMLGDVQNLRFTYIDNTAALKWDVVDSLWPVRYEIRIGDSWESGFLIGDEASPQFTTFGDGTYWVAAKVQPAPGVVKYSEHPVQNIVAGSVLVQNVVALFDEAAGGWAGTITGDGAIDGGNFVTTASGSITYYQVPTAHVVPVGYSRPTRLNATLKPTGVPVSSDFLANPDFLGTSDMFDAEAARKIEAWVEVAVAQETDNDAFGPTDIFAEPDAFLAGINFGDWVKFAPGVYVGGRFKMQVALRSNDPAVQGVVTAFTWSVDVPDRVDHVIDHALLAAGETFIFAPDATGTPTPFNGGPNGQATPLVVVNVINGVAGDTVLITGKTLNQVTVQVINAGVGAARTINAFFQGW